MCYRGGGVYGDSVTGQGAVWGQESESDLL